MNRISKPVNNLGYWRFRNIIPCFGNTIGFPKYNLLFRTLHTIKAPPLPESFKTGLVAEWHAMPNEYVNLNQLIYTYDTGKSLVEIYAPASGLIMKHLVEIKEEVKPGQPLMIIDETAKNPNIHIVKFILTDEHKKQIQLAKSKNK